MVASDGGVLDDAVYDSHLVYFAAVHSTWGVTNGLLTPLSRSAISWSISGVARPEYRAARLRSASV